MTASFHWEGKLYPATFILLLFETLVPSQKSKRSCICSGIYHVAFYHFLSDFGAAFCFSICNFTCRWKLNDIRTLTQTSPNIYLKMYSIHHYCSVKMCHKQFHRLSELLTCGDQYCPDGLCLFLTIEVMFIGHKN